VTVSTPLSRLAVMSSSLTLSGSAKVREKDTEVRSRRTTCRVATAAVVAAAAAKSQMSNVGVGLC
jgi:hypothetical protein